MTNITQTSSRASGTFEFFSYRGTFHCPPGPISEDSGATTDVPLTPVADPLARLTRERSAQRLRLATAERTARPPSTYSQQGSRVQGTRAPPTSARTPPSFGLSLEVSGDGKANRPSSFISSSFTYTYAQVNGPVSNHQAQPKPASRPQTAQPSPTKRKPASQFPPTQAQNARKQPATPNQQQQRPRAPQSADQNQLRNMKAAERCKQLERTLREVQELLRDRDREVAQLKKDRDRLLAEREHDKKVMREREQMRARERGLEQAREKQREKEREQEKQRELERQREREKERERERERQQERELEERQRRFTHSNSIRRARSQTPSSPVHASYSSSHMDVEQHAQIRSLDVFLTKTDGWSGAQVIQAVEDLNAEISHFAASATEVCVFDRHPLPSNSRRSRNSRRGRGSQNDLDAKTIRGSLMSPDEAAEIAPWLGQSFARILATRDHEQDPVLVQLALQASVATCCARSLSLFCVGFPSKLDTLLSRVFSHMQRSEPQPTSSRWRALTHRSIRSLYPGLEEYAVSELATTMMRWSGTIFTMSGCRLPITEGKDKEGALTSLRTHLRRIAEAVFNLARITREEILSTNFEIVLAESGHPFVSSGMTNALDEFRHGTADGKMSQGNVLCTTELGLRCTTKKGKSIYTMAEGEELFERRILLRPKVVLDSTVDALDKQ